MCHRFDIINLDIGPYTLALELIIFINESLNIYCIDSTKPTLIIILTIFTRFMNKLRHFFLILKPPIRVLMPAPRNIVTINISIKSKTPKIDISPLPFLIALAIETTSIGATTEQLARATLMILAITIYDSLTGKVLYIS